MSFDFTVETKCLETRARTGLFNTPHGPVETPVFMPVGTKATVKAMTPEMVASTGAGIVLGNTYHLMLRPSAERVAAMNRYNLRLVKELVDNEYDWIEPHPS